jgi:hypothetical protein
MKNLAWYPRIVREYHIVNKESEIHPFFYEQTKLALVLYARYYLVFCLWSHNRVRYDFVYILHAVFAFATEAV